MDRRLLDGLVPGVYALAVVVTTLVSDSAVVVVATVGAMLMGLYYSAVRRHLTAPEDDRNRDRNRKRG